jgi:hypothetical protein
LERRSKYLVHNTPKEIAMKRVMLTLLAMFAAPAFAGGTWNNVTVKSLTTYTPEAGFSSPLVEIVFSAAATGGASCGSGNPTIVMVDISTPSGAAAVTFALRALSMGYTVYATGTGTCGLVSGLETLSQVQIFQ